MKQIQVIMIVGIIAVCAPVDAQQVHSLTVDDTIARALRVSEEHQISDNELEKRDAQYRQARAGIYPQIAGTVTWLNNVEYPQASRPAVQDYGFDAGVSVSQLLWSFGKVTSAIQFAEHYVAAGRWERAATQQEIIYATQLKYFSVILAQHTYRILSESLEHAQENKRLLETLSSAGRGAKRDLIKMEADIAARMPRVNDARAALDAAMRSLKVCAGIPETDTVVLSESAVPDIGPDEPGKYRALQRAHEPALQALAAAVDAQDAAVKIKRAEYYPVINAFAGWNEKGVADDADLYAGDVDGYGVVGVKLSVPLWTSGLLAAQLTQSRMDQSTARLRLKKAEKDLALELENALSAYRSLTATLEANGRAVELAEASFAMARDMFGSGQISVSDLNDAELLLTGEKINEQLSRYNLRLTAATIQRLAGVRR